MDGNDKSLFHEDPSGLSVHTAPLDGAAQVYVPTHMCRTTRPQSTPLC